jgi:hypothetical protein
LPLAHHGDINVSPIFQLLKRLKIILLQDEFVVFIVNSQK